METASVFENNRTQAVRLPAGSRFPKQVKKVFVRVVGESRILEPLNHSWTSFFSSADQATDDFLPQRASQQQSDRESL